MEINIPNMSQQKFNEYVTEIKKKNIGNAMEMWCDVFMTMKTDYYPQSSVLHIAAANGVTELISFFIGKGLKVDVTDSYGYTPLHRATENGYHGVVIVLLQHAANVNLVDNRGYSPLHHAAGNGYHDVVTLLIQHGANVNAVDYYGSSPLHHSTENGHRDILTLLFQYGADVNLMNESGYSPLHLAAENYHHAIVTLLLQNGANVNSVDNNGVSPLHSAAGYGYHDVVSSLLQYSANVNSVDNYGYSPLHRATTNGHLDVVTLLLQYSADVNLLSKYGYSSLHRAAENGYHDIVTILLQNGAKVNVINEDGQTPLKLAESRNYLTCVSILKEASIIESDNVDEFRKVFGNEVIKLNKEIISRIYKRKPKKIIEYICSCPITEEETAAPEMWQHETILCEINLIRSIKLSQCKMFKDAASIKLINADALLNDKCALHLAVDSKSDIMVNEVMKLLDYDNDIINTILHSYQDRNNNMLNMLQNRQSSLESFYKRGYSRLDVAVMDCSKVMLQYLLEKETNKNTISKALSIAIEHNCQQCVSILTEKNVDYNDINKMGQTLMHLAIEKGNSSICQTLIEKCSNFGEKDYLSLTALHRAVMYKEENLIGKMVEKDKYWNTDLLITKPKKTSFFKTSDESNNVLQKMCQNQFNIIYDQLTTKETTLSLYMKAYNDVPKSILNAICEKDVQFQDGLGNTLLHTAVSTCNVKTCMEISKNFQRTLSIKNFEKVSPLRLAVRKYKENCNRKVDLLNIIKCFIQMGATLEQIEPNTKSIIQEAINIEDEELLIVLVGSKEMITVLTDAEFRFIIERQFYKFLYYLSVKLHKRVINKLITEDVIKELFEKCQYNTLTCFFQHLNLELRKSFLNEYLYIAYKEGNRDFFVNLCKLNDAKAKLLDNGESIMTLIINDDNKTFFSHLLESRYAKQLVNMSNYTNNLPIHLIIKKEWYDLSYSVVRDTDNVDEENEEGDTPIAILIKQLGSSVDNIVRANKVMNLIYALIIEGSSNIYRVSNVTHKSPISYSGKYRLTIEEYYKKHGKVKQECSAGDDIKATDTSDKQGKPKICLICIDREPDCALDCGHVFCSQCIKRVDRCPNCRGQISNPRKLFF